jgi:hypothetical protein
MEWVLGDKDVWSSELEYPVKRAISFDPTVASCTNIYRVSRGCFPWVSYGLATPWRVRLVGQPGVSAHKGHNFWSDSWMALKILHGFPEAVFIGVAMEWLLGDEDVWSWELEYALKRAITFDPTVWSHSKFYRGFQRLFSLGKPWNRCSVTRMSCRQPWVSTKKGHNFWSDRWIVLKYLQGFLEAVLLGVAMEGYSVTRMSGCQTWVSAQKGHIFWSDHSIALKFL